MRSLERAVQSDISPSVTGGTPSLDTNAPAPNRRDALKAIGIASARPITDTRSDTGKIVGEGGAVIGTIDVAEIADYLQTQAVDAARADRSGRSGQVHTVVAGDTLIKLARENGVTLDSLIKANPIFKRDDPNMIKAGMELVVPPKKSA